MDELCLATGGAVNIETHYMGKDAHLSTAYCVQTALNPLARRIWASYACTMQTTNGLTIAPGDPRGAEAAALLRQSHDLMGALFPPEDNFFLDAEALCTPDIRFFVALRGGETVGTGALALRAGYGEVKSMFVAEAARGQGVAEALLARIEAEARAHGLPYLRLETGDRLIAALRLYARHGFERRGPFGDYPDAASSVFMEKALVASRG